MRRGVAIAVQGYGNPFVVFRQCGLGWWRGLKSCINCSRHAGWRQVGRPLAVAAAAAVVAAVASGFRAGLYPGCRMVLGGMYTFRTEIGVKQRKTRQPPKANKKNTCNQG